jgi:hypothetical protein
MAINKKKDFLREARAALASQSRGFAVEMYAPAGVRKLAPKMTARLAAAGITLKTGKQVAKEQLAAQAANPEAFKSADKKETDETVSANWKGPKWSGYKSTGSAIFRGGPAAGSQAELDFYKAGGQVSSVGNAYIPKTKKAIEKLGIMKLRNVDKSRVLKRRKKKFGDITE